ncbi:hypothetical protein [Paenarthrobacter ureafaciens]|nr:hypothetical protein [Paenarthrobacter ureafaciens]QQQ64414.1 hypothetical protein JHQ56_19270 [Paenarthrobacter ureafaciens]QQQ64420.1 hypothetical protein JHQ56_19305 [Paenarthrobacter ureafaciens]
MTAEISPRMAVRGRPRTTGAFTCDRCSRAASKHRASWPEGRICGTCFTVAMRTHGNCPGCGTERMLPGRSASHSDNPVCADCAGITQDYHCSGCGTETEHYRQNTCARCSLRSDLAGLLHVDESQGTETTAAKLLGALTGAQRPESILTWLRKSGVRELLERVAIGEIPLSHEALDREPRSLRVEHLRSLLIHHKLLPIRDHYLALFERWLSGKLDDIDDIEVRRTIESFARWHHLRRIRTLSTDGKPTRGPVHSAKQEITETIKFLVWLKVTHGRTVASCLQADVDAWLADGPTTRHAIRTFFVWAVKNRTCTNITIGFRQAKTVPLLTQAQRLTMLKACLTDNIDTLSYRVAATLLLLYAQPVVKIAAMKSTDVVLTPDGPRLSLGEEHPAPVPEPFASLLITHLAARPNMRTGSSSGSLWLFPGYRAGQHIHPNTLMMRLREIGIDLLGARNASLRGLVNKIPAPLVAEMLGYSYQITQKHATAAAEPWSRYASPGR